ncbi:zf-DHHC-domain-containing protein [Whalleya microplaca]|nr:zf-DHHC-domain-containing protein [Whalleya microplaca]
MPTIESTRAATRWITRSIPVLLAAAVGFATYVVVARVCSSYLINTRVEIGSAIAILILYFLLLLLMVAAYLRTITTVLFDPGVVPLGPLAVERRKVESNKRKEGRRREDIESRPYNATPDPDPDSPGLEKFYTKDVFVCENDGRPKWCSECCNWKADRVHHSTEINRCVYRMDHYCPWVGGMIGENSFKFFVQFTAYTACYCTVVLGATASSLRKQIGEGLPLDPYLLAGIVLASFFGLFTFLMTVTSVRYIFLNMTNVDMLGYRSKVYQLAVQVPRGTQSTDKFTVVTYPLPKPGEAMIGRFNGTAMAGTSEISSIGVRSTISRSMTRDNLATRTFAILRTEPGENPWDIGLGRNWQSVMGSNAFDWFLPFRKSPCVNHESHESFYPMDRVLENVRARYGLPSLTNDNAALEMRELGASRM